MTVDDIINMIHEEFQGVKAAHFSSTDEAVKVAASALRFLYEHIEDKEETKDADV